MPKASFMCRSGQPCRNGARLFGTYKTMNEETICENKSWWMAGQGRVG